MFGPGFLRPSRVLGLLICAVVGSFSGFVWWQVNLVDPDPRALFANQWVLAFGAFTAMVGWMVSSLVTVRNVVKQHTVSTLLQSRLAAAYVEKLSLVNQHYSKIGEEVTAIPEADMTDGTKADQIAAMRYLLNHFEFIALAIRYGDLDEVLMKGSMQGIVCNLAKVGGPLIDKAVKKEAGNFYHLRWLVQRWEFVAATSKDVRRDAQWENFWLAIAGVVTLAIAATVCGWGLKNLTSVAKGQLAGNGQTNSQGGVPSAAAPASAASAPNFPASATSPNASAARGTASKAKQP